MTSSTFVILPGGKELSDLNVLNEFSEDSFAHICAQAHVCAPWSAQTFTMAFICCAVAALLTSAAVYRHQKHSHTPALSHAPVKQMNVFRFSASIIFPHSFMLQSLSF